MEIIAFSSILFAIVCGVLANSKNRSGWGWAFLGLFFGIFALIAIVCLPKLEDIKE